MRLWSVWDHIIHLRDVQPVAMTIVRFCLIGGTRWQRRVFHKVQIPALSISKMVLHNICGILIMLSSCIALFTDAIQWVLIESTSSRLNLIWLPHEALLKHLNFGCKAVPTHTGSVQKQGVKLSSVRSYGPVVSKISPDIQTTLFRTSIICKNKKIKPYPNGAILHISHATYA